MVFIYSGSLGMFKVFSMFNFLEHADPLDPARGPLPALPNDGEGTRFGFPFAVISLNSIKPEDTLGSRSRCFRANDWLVAQPCDCCASLGVRSKQVKFQG